MARRDQGETALVKKQLFLISLVALFLSLLAFVRTEGVSIYKIQGEMLKGEGEMPSADSMDSLHQRFTYLGRGRQCFVFVSEDGKSVLKFLDYTRFYFPKALLRWPFFGPWQGRLKKYALFREGRYRKTIESLLLAKRYLSEESGIEYLHLHEGGAFPRIEILGPAGRLRRIDVTRTTFFLQKRADASLLQRVEEGIQEEEIRATLAFLAKRCSLGIADDDQDLAINFGFVKSSPFLIDPGRLYISDKVKEREGKLREIKKVTRKLHRRLLEKDPAMAEFYFR